MVSLILVLSILLIINGVFSAIELWHIHRIEGYWHYLKRGWREGPDFDSSPQTPKE